MTGNNNGNRENYRFAGSDAGGRRAAARYPLLEALLESAKLNGLNPPLSIADLPARTGDHPARPIADLLPWNGKPAAIIRAA